MVEAAPGGQDQTMSLHPRSQIYYWKCDRPAAFHGTAERERDDAGMKKALTEALQYRFPDSSISLRSTPSQGNHLTFVATVDGQDRFVRIEDGPEADDYLEVESRVMMAVRGLGIPVPAIHAIDASRRDVPFAWQVMDLIQQPDLNHHYKAGRLDMPAMAGKIGAAIATWQSLPVKGFGPFNPGIREELNGFHATYPDYFHKHLDRHLHFLLDHQFLTRDEADEMACAIERHHSLLQLDSGCLVHKDLALWNILGSETEITAFIDFDDTIAGDPMDDLSLLACFHDTPVIEHALAGYATVRALPDHHGRRLALHLLRNMIVKAVIRLGAGYFDRTSSFFLIGAGGSGTDLRSITKAKLAAALRSLQ